jgi:hypothetical protein
MILSKYLTAQIFSDDDEDEIRRFEGLLNPDLSSFAEKKNHPHLTTAQKPTLNT